MNMWAMVLFLAAADPPGTVKVMSSAPPLVDQATNEPFILINPEEVISVFAVGPAKLQCSFRINVGKKAKTAPTVTLELTTAAKEPVKLRIIPRLNKTAWKRSADLRPSESAEFYIQIPDGPQLFEFKIDGVAKQGGALRVADSFTSRHALAVDAPVLTLQGMPVSMPGAESSPEAAPEPAPMPAPTPAPMPEPTPAPVASSSSGSGGVKPKPVVQEVAPAEPQPVVEQGAPKMLHLRALAGAGLLAESSGGLGSSGAFESQLGVRLAFTPAWSVDAGWELRVGDIAVPFRGAGVGGRTTEVRHAAVINAGFAPALTSFGSSSFGLALTAGYRLHVASNQLAGALTGYLGAQAGVFLRTSAMTLRALGGGAAALHDSTAVEVALGKNVARFSATLEAEIAVAGPLALVTSYRGEFLLRQFALRQAHTVLLGVAMEFL